MLALATGGQASFGISSDEVDRGGVSYSVETVQRLSLQYSGDELLLILGPDALADLPTWREPDKILSLSKLIAVERAGIDTIATVLATAALASLLGPDGVAAVVASRVICSAIGIRASDLRSAVAAGAEIVILTNACGSINPSFPAGTPVLLRDHINLTGQTPMAGPPPPEPYAIRFVDLTDAYSPRLRALAQSLVDLEAKNRFVSHGAVQ